MTRSKDLFAVTFLVAAGWLVVCWPWLSGTVTIPYDAKAHFHAQLAFLAQSIHAGQSPFWLPYAFSGHPQIADPQSLIFSPYLLLALATPNPSFQAADAVSLLMLLFGAMGIVLYGRDRGWHPAALVVAALTFCFAAGAGWRIQHTGQILSLSYFPWAFVMLDRALRRASLPYGALSGLFAALMLLNRDQVAFMGALILAGMVVSHWLSGAGRWGRVRASLLPLMTGGVVGAAFLLIPLLMTLAFADGSNRAKFSLEDAELGSLHFTNLLTFAFPNLFGVIGPDAEYWGAPSLHWPIIVPLYLARNMAMVYLGAFALIGVIVAVFLPAIRREAAARFALLALIFAVLYGLGRYTPFFAIIFKLVPGVDLFRRPADATFLIGVMGAIAGGFGLDALLRGAALPWAWLLRIIAFFTFAALVLAYWLGKTSAALPPMALGFGFLAACLWLIWFAQNPASARRPLLMAGLFALLITADFRINLRPNESTGLPPSEFEAMQVETTNPLITTLKAHVVRGETRRDRVEFSGLGFHWPNLGLIHQLESTLGYNPLRLKYYSDATLVGGPPRSPEQRPFGALMPSYASPLADLLGLRFIIVRQQDMDVCDPNEKGRLKRIYKGPEGSVYENPHAYPRVMVVQKAVPLDQDQLVATGAWPVGSDGQMPDFHRIAYVAPNAPPIPEAAAPSTARITHYENTRVEIAVDAPAGGLLVLNDIWHPWWVAEVDGRKADIFRTNGLFRGVILPAGAKAVTFRFEPFSGLFQHYARKLSNAGKG